MPATKTTPPTSAARPREARPSEARRVAAEAIHPTWGCRAPTRHDGTGFLLDTMLLLTASASRRPTGDVWLEASDWKRPAGNVRLDAIV